MPQEGLRVVRGPEWSRGDEDGGEGYTGTLYHVDMIDKTAIVQWDNGKQILCKIGQMDTYELRIVDNAQIGVRHVHFQCGACSSDGRNQSPNSARTAMSSKLGMNFNEDVEHFAVYCDECKVKYIRGRRYKCRDCLDYDLCELCYQRNKHDISHSFIKIDSQNCEGITLLPRQIWRRNQGAGTVHYGVVCHGCNSSDIRGIRYKCRSCDDYDLCDLCYHRNKHALDHSFEEIASPNHPGLNLAPRLASRVNFPPESVHIKVRCDGCRIFQISGIRYKCRHCFNYDLCDSCYRENKHDVYHSFIRVDFPNSLGVYLAPRSVPVMNDVQDTLHTRISCDGCDCRGIRGIRYKCNNCYNYDLCNICYHGNKHDLSHTFTRIDTPDCPRFDLPPRQSFDAVNEASIHRGIRCDGCNFRNIPGIRYKCSNCANYDLCETCYNTNKHEPAHVFRRLDLPSSVGIILPPRSISRTTKIQDTVHEDIFSNEDSSPDILGMRYTCNDCDNYDLCYICYHGGKHNLLHRFRRIETPESIGINLPPRLYSRKCQLRGIFKGAKVIQGIDSDWDNSERGQSGVVLDIVKFNSHNSWRSAAYVKWLNGETQLCRLGYKGHCDIQFVEAALGNTGSSQYYPEHLPILGQSQEQMKLHEVTGSEEIYEDEHHHASDTENGPYSIGRLSLNETKESYSVVGSSLENNKTIKPDETSVIKEQLKQLETKIAEMEERQTCPICLENKRDTVFLCGHSTCSKCADGLVLCHMCRKTIEKKIRIY